MIIHSKPKKTPKKETKVPTKVVVPTPEVKEQRPTRKVEEERVDTKRLSDLFAEDSEKE